MTTYGMTSTGFVRKPLLQIKTDLENALKSVFGQNIKLDTKSVFGKLVGAFSQPMSDVWELAELLYSAMYPSTATTDSAIDGTCEIVGIARKPATPSEVMEVLEGVVGTVIPASSKIATETVGDQFQTTAEITLATGVAVTVKIGLVGSVTNGKVYTITIQGTDYTYTATVPSDDADAVGAALVAAINQAVTTDTYATQDSDENLYGGSTEGTAQSFTGDGNKLTSVTFKLKKNGAPTGYATVKLYTHDGTFGTSSVPIGDPLAVSPALDVSTLTTGYVDTEFVFDADQIYQLVNGTKYVVAIEYSGGDSSNYLQVGVDAGGAHGGNQSTFNGTVWSAVAADDLYFIAESNNGVLATDLGDGEFEVQGDDDSEGLPSPFSVSVNANLSILWVGNLQELESVDSGPVVGYAGTINQIVNPLSGWVDAWNPLDAVLGELVESNATVRARRSVSLSIPGAGTPEAMLAGLLAITEVTAAIVIENTTNVTDANGVPAHSIECVVENGDEEDIGAVLWARKPGGINLHGDESVTVEDSQGYDHALGYSRPTEVLQWLKATYTLYDEEDFPDNGEDTMKSTLLAYGNGLGIGKDVMPHRFKGDVFDAVAGIKTLLIERADDSGGSPGAYSETPKAIEFNEIAKFDTARITIVGP